VARLAAEGVVCDICPASNVALGVVERMSDHPAPLLAAAGVAVTLNADDQLWFGASITDQYETARSVWGLDDAAVARFALAGTGAAGMSTTTRRTLETGVREWLEEKCP
jgi:adenosine deaminase